MKPDIQPLAELIERQISYDANETQSEIRCPKCDEIVQPRVLNYWIDHRDSLVAKIATHLGLRDHSRIDDVLGRETVEGVAATDAPALAQAILDELYL